ncbi:Dihydrolipoyl dehydrogenase [bioreactor metagenome]|uniref:Dihydrolipoyl dehydrogenase n=1 Tax=bioreactor metagenome TaxID=1076179 RepID=A0A645DLY5_9ZZZZ
MIASIPSLQIESRRLLNSTSALDLPAIPKSLLVVGGGYIGLELGSVYATLGSKVSVVEFMDRILPGADQDLVSHLQKRISKSFDKIMLQSKVVEIKEEGEELIVKIENKDKQIEEHHFDYVLMSIGRKPQTAGLGLESTKVKVNERGWIIADKSLKTDDDNIYAIGDIVGEPMLAHKASHEGRVAVDAISGKKVAFEPLAIPAVVFTDPEIAWAGITENQAIEKGIKFELAKFPWAASGRATTLDRSDGVTKLIIDPDTERILGIGLCGPGAGEMIAEGVLAIEMGATVKDLALTIHPHPTLSETVMEAAELFYGHSSHLYKPAKKG